MAKKTGVFLVQYSGHDDSLTVSGGGKSEPMQEFLRRFTPTQVTSWTHAVPGSQTQQFIALLIAEGEFEPGEEWFVC